MMIGESTRTFKVAPWDPFDVLSPNAGFLDSLSSLHRFLPSNLSDEDNVDSTCLVSSDQFRMFEFKVRRCARGRSHDWTECPYAHPGEKARRRDPRKYHYSGSACPEFRKGFCPKGDACDSAHGVFECWLHPTRYRTQPCKDGLACHRRVCFFAHTPQQLRVLPGHHHGGAMSPPVSPPSESPPRSPNSPQIRLGALNELMASMRGFKLGNNNMQVGSPPVSWVGSPRGPLLRPGFFSLPNTPTRSNPGRCGPGAFDLWEKSLAEEPAMERVESGRDLRERMYAKLSKENSMGRVGRVDPVGFSGADVDWVSELVSEEEEA